MTRVPKEMLAKDDPFLRMKPKVAAGVPDDDQVGAFFAQCVCLCGCVFVRPAVVLYLAE